MPTAPPIVGKDRPPHGRRRILRRRQKRLNSGFKRQRRWPMAIPREARHCTARKTAKRARYIAEVCEPVLGKLPAPLSNGLRGTRPISVNIKTRSWLSTSFAGSNGSTFGVLLSNETRVRDLSQHLR